MNKINAINKIKKFLDGHNNDVKYLVNIETDPNTNYAECFFHQPNGSKYKKQIHYEPFLYIKDLSKHNIKLYSNREDVVFGEKKIQHGVTIKKLRTDNQKRLEDGFCYRISSTKSFNAILNFLKEGGLNVYEKQYDEDGKLIKKNDITYYPNKEYVYMIKPVEQFLISTGIRLYKGIDDYSSIHKVIFDIETTGLRYETTQTFAIGIRDNKGFEKILEVKELNNQKEEEKLVKDFFKTVVDLEPAIIAGYNSEDFDFNYLLGRSNKLGLEYGNNSIITTTLDPSKSIIRTFGSLKHGSTTEKYTATKIYGTSVIDILHAVKKTSAINTEIKNNKLKYICQFENIAKENRVYINGEDNEISKKYFENKIHITDKNFNYLVVPDEYQDIAKKLYKIQGNLKIGNIDKTQAKELRNKVLSESSGDFINWFKENGINNNKKYFISGKVLLRQYLKDDLWETEKVDELYNQSSFMLAKMIPTTYDRICTMGTASIWELLLTTWSYENNLAIPNSDEKGDISGGLARCFKGGFSENIIKIDYGSLYPMIQLTHDVFPSFDITGVMKMILIYLTTTRNIYKKIAGGFSLDKDEVELFNAIDYELQHKYKAGLIEKEDKSKSKVKQLPIKILNNSLFGALGSDVSFKWSDNKCAARITCTGRLYLRSAISWFSEFGCVPLLAVTDGVNFQIPEKTNIRVTDIAVLKEENYDNPDKMWEYGGAKGINALINKFNAEVLPAPYMTIDDDGSAYSALNLSRINYATLFKERDSEGNVIDKIKLTGNTIKSKTMPEYIEDFLDVGIKLILNGKGKEFVDHYYDYVDNIFYKRIPLKKIASKSKVKTKIGGYLKRGKDKNGRLKAMQAHMELIINERKSIARELLIEKGKEIVGKVSEYSFLKHTFDDLILYAKQDSEFVESLTEAKKKKFDNEIFKIVSDYMPPEPELDTTIYHYNTGYRKSHGDVKEIKDKETGKIRMASQLVNQKDLIENPDMLGDYNIDKYLDSFNKRVEKFLVGFDEEIRDKILVKIKRGKKKNKLGVDVEYEHLVKNEFTNSELILKNFNLDSLDEAYFLESKEIKFWNDYGYNPKMVWDGFKVNDGELKYDEYLEVLDFLNEKMKESNKPLIKSVDDDLIDEDFVLVKERNEYHIGIYMNGVIKIMRYNINTPKTKELLKKEEEERRKDDALNKLKIQETRDTSRDEHYFKLFKKKFKISEEFDGLSMEEFFVVLKEAEKPFKLFIQEIEELEMSEYDPVD